MIKNLRKVETEGSYHNIISTINDKYSVGKNLKAFPFRSGTRQGGPLSPLLLNIYWKS